MDDKEFMPGLTKKPYYEIIDEEELKIEDLMDGAVILNDYCLQLSQTRLPRQAINDKIIQLEADYIPFMHTAALNSTGISGVRVNATAESASVLEVSNTIYDAALNQKKYIPMVGKLDF